MIDSAIKNKHTPAAKEPRLTALRLDMGHLPYKSLILGGKRFSRRGMLVTGLAVIASGCVRDPVISNAVSVFKHLTSGQRDQAIDRETVAKVPYALVTAKIGKGPRAVLVLTQRDRRDLFWSSADRITLVTRNGRIVKTAGLRQNLAFTRAMPDDPLAAAPQRMTEPVELHRVVDLRTASGYLTMAIESILEPLRREKITILGLDFETILIREVSRARSMNWKFENFYWVDAFDGFTWKSRQRISRDLPPIEIETLKPAA